MLIYCAHSKVELQWRYRFEPLQEETPPERGFIVLLETEPDSAAVAKVSLNTKLPLRLVNAAPPVTKNSQLLFATAEAPAHGGEPTGAGARRHDE